MNNRNIAKIKKEGRVKKPRFGMMPKLKINKAIKWLPIMGIIVAYLILFFFLKDKLLITPDMDRSDAFHFNISLKYFLWENIQKWHLPFWTQQLQGGFPLFAEGQIGTLFLPNLVFMRLFNFVTAYNGLFVFSLFCSTLGMFLLLKRLKVATLLSLILALIFTWSGAITFRFIHFNLIQTYSLTPFIFLAVFEWHKTNKKVFSILSSFLISQMIFAGHYQVAFIVLFSLFLWWAIILKRESPWGFVFLILNGFMLALPQLIPTYMLTRFSSRISQGGYDFATLYSLPWQHILSFIFPYPFGNVQNGTYPDSLSQWGVFWENSPHIGLLFFICFFSVLIYLAIKKKLSSSILVLLLLSCIFILFSLGKNSPVYFIFDVFPFNLFRTPPKYLLQAVFFLILASTYCFQAFFNSNNKKIYKFIIYFFLFCNLLYLTYIPLSYHVFMQSNNVFQSPTILASVQKKSKYITYGFSKIWHTILSQSGWKTKKELEKYQFLNNFLIPNSNLLYGRNSFDFNTGGLRIRRNDYMNSITENAIFGSDYKGPVTASAQLLLDLLQINTVISSTPLTIEGLEQKKHLTDDNISIYLYETVFNHPTSYYVPDVAKNIQYKEDLANLLESGYISTQSAVIEDYKDIFQKNITRPLLQTNNDNFTGYFSQKTFIVFNESWYPELQVKIDSKLIKPIKTNLIHIGVFAPKGFHTISIHYWPLYFITGLEISIGYFVSIYLVYFLILRLKIHKK